MASKQTSSRTGINSHSSGRTHGVPRPWSSFMSVEEPPKPQVLAWLSRAPGQPGETLTRRARTVLSGVFEAVVDLDAKRLVSVVERKGLQSPVTGSEAGQLSRIALGTQMELVIELP